MRNDMKHITFQGVYRHRNSVLSNDDVIKLRQAPCFEFDEDGEIETHRAHCRYKSMNSQNGEGKVKSFNLKAFLRFLDKSIGRKWNDVYSEICEAIPHNKTHLTYFFFKKRYVELDVHMKDGVPYKYGAGGECRIDSIAGIFNRYYVDPSNGKLCKSKRVNWG